jgi:hypothetical protein
MRSVTKMIGVVTIGASMYVGSAHAVNLVDPVCGTTLPAGTHTLTVDHRGTGAFCYQIPADNTTLNCQRRTIRRWGTRGGTAIVVTGSATHRARNVRINDCGTVGWTMGLSATKTENLVIEKAPTSQTSYGAGTTGIRITDALRPTLRVIAAPGNGSHGIHLIDTESPTLDRVSARSNAGHGLVVSNTHRGVMTECSFRNNGSPDVALQSNASFNGFWYGDISRLRLASGAHGNRAHCVALGSVTNDGTAIDNTATCP